MNKLTEISKIIDGYVLNGDLFNSFFENEKFYAFDTSYKFDENALDYRKYKQQLADGYMSIPYVKCEYTDIMTGGIEFINEADFINALSDNRDNLIDSYRIIEIPNDAIIYIDTKNFKTDKAVCSQSYELSSLPIWSDDEICRRLAYSYPYLIRFMKNKEESLYMLAIDRDPYVLEYIDEADQTENICLAAVMKNSSLFRYAKKINIDICEATIKKSAYSILSIPDEHITEELSMLAVSVNGLVLKYVKDEYKTDDVCNSAIMQNGNAIEFVPNPTDEQYKVAIEVTPYAIQFMKKPSLELCISAIKKDMSVLKYINNPPEELYLEVVKLDGTAIKYMDTFNFETFLTALSNTSLAMKYLSPDYEDEDLCFTSVVINPDCVKYIDDHWIRNRCITLLENISKN